ncbi:MAG: hypothetical protein QOC95_1956 [Thermoleophilaceae bacterium]|nr:hypothetical protein [Thermoleophilaceae bacterium]
MSSLALRRGTVLSVDRPGPAAELTVDVAGERRRALSFEGTTGAAEAGDDVVLNVAAVDLALGSGGFDIVHVNLTRGLGGAGEPGAHVMKLNYTSLQHAVHPVEEEAESRGQRAEGELPFVSGRPVAVIALHAQLPCVAWAAAQARPGARVGYVQTAGGALPGAMSRVVREMLESGLLAGHVTAAPAFGGSHEAITVAGGLHAGLTALGWHAAIAGPGPGILGSATALGHGGLAALDNAHAALALGATAIVVPRMSSGDARPRHRGLSHHTRTVLGLMLAPALVALPEGVDQPLPGEHEARFGAADLAGYRGSGLPVRTMGRGPDEDDLFFRASLAGGSVLAGEIR